MSLLKSIWFCTLVIIVAIILSIIYSYYRIEPKSTKNGFSDETLILEEIDGFFPLEMLESFDIK